jgi:hypothetical protein
MRSFGTVIASLLNMADPGKVYPAELHLLKKELEAQGELLSQERLDRRADVDQLRLELESFKQLIERLHPGAIAKLREIYAKESRSWNPEFERKEG